MIEELQDYLAKEFNIHFDNPALLAEAFTQASYVNEHPNQGLKYYERIEFLGDAVLELIVSEYIYKRFPGATGRKLTRLRAAMVCEDSFLNLPRNVTLINIFAWVMVRNGWRKENVRFAM